MTSVTLVLGGTRSGKSVVAESIAASTAGRVTYVATARVAPDDADHQARIAAHRDRRPAEWSTIECPVPGDLPAVLAGIDGTVLVDSLGSWVGGHPDLTAVDAGPVVDALVARAGITVVVSDEVGLAVHAPTELGRAFVDAMGTVNQQVSAIAERAVLVVAGRVLELPSGAESC